METRSLIVDRGGIHVCFTKLKTLLEQLWYLLGPVFGCVGKFLSKIGSERASTLFYLTSTFLVLLGARSLLQQRKYLIPLKPQALRTADLANSPEDAVVETLEKISFYRRKGISMINWFKKNIGAIISVLELIAAIAVHVSGVIPLEGIWQTVAICVIYGIPVVTAVLTSGFTSAEVQEAIDKCKEALKQNKNSRRDELKALNNALENTEKALADVRAKLVNIQVLKNVGAPYDINEYNMYHAQETQLADTVAKLKKQITGE